MARFGEIDRPGERGPFSSGSGDVRVHVLSEYVFCPRAAVLALESGGDEGEEECPLGPRLDGFADYDERRFVEALHLAWGDLRLWLMLLALASVCILLVWRLVPPLFGVLLAISLLYPLAKKSRDTLIRIWQLIRERAAFAAAVPAAIDLESPEIREVNWWSLRKAGFDCFKPVEPHRDPAQRLTGRPWRILIKDTILRIPVVRKHRGDRKRRPQHVVRIAAYCQLIETCEGGQSPFGILMFANSYDCLIIPNTVRAQLQFEQALAEIRELLRVYEEGESKPPAPADNRCSGCHFGEPRKYVAGQTDTILGGRPVKPRLTRAANWRRYHCTCGDRFDWVPPHEDAVMLRIAKPR